MHAEFRSGPVDLEGLRDVVFNFPTVSWRFDSPSMGTSLEKELTPVSLSPLITYLLGLANPSFPVSRYHHVIITYLLC